MDKKITLRSVLFAIIALVLVACAYGGGVATGYFLPSRTPAQETTPTQVVPTTDPADTGTPGDLEAQFKPFWEAWDIVHQHYVDQPVDDTKLMEGAIQGMLESLGDPHSGYWSPQETTDVSMAMQGEYDGIGAYVDTGGEYLTITKPIPGYPAEAAGLQIGDQIIAVDGQDVTGMDPDLVRLTMVLGPAGSDVHLTIRREGLEQPLEFTITRAHIVIPSVTSKMLDNNIAYIQITLFGDNTASVFHDQLGQLIAQAPQGLILDLRDNTGGYLDTGIAVASEFIDQGVIVIEKFGDDTRTPYEADPGGVATSIPLVILVNEYTASASEIVAGAIQDYGRGKLVGETTYGKGSVQYWLPVSDGGTVRVTIAKWLTPDGRTIDKVGLTPDVVIERTTEDYNAGLDPQLDAAIELLLTP